VIAAQPSLNQIRANHVTRIEAQPSALELLPFLLRAPCSADDFDESPWSTAGRELGLPLIERLRVLAVMTAGSGQQS
jgi:hypothetical protein